MIADADQQRRHLGLGDRVGAGARIAVSAARVDHAVHGEGADADAVEKVDDLLDMIAITLHQRGVRDCVHTDGHGVLDAAHGLLPGRRAVDGVVQIGAAGGERHLDVVEPRVGQGLHKRPMRDPPTVGVQAADMAEPVGVGDQLG